jgi:hypothetical protein
MMRQYAMKNYTYRAFLHAIISLKLVLLLSYILIQNDFQSNIYGDTIHAYIIYAPSSKILTQIQSRLWR